MHRMLAFPRALFLQLNFRRAAGDLDLGAIVQIIALRALKPGHLAIFFCHCETSGARSAVARSQKKNRVSLFWLLTPGSWLLFLTPESSSPHPNRPSCRLRGRRSAASLPWRWAPAARLP